MGLRYYWMDWWNDTNSEINPVALRGITVDTKFFLEILSSLGLLLIGMMAKFSPIDGWRPVRRYWIYFIYFGLFSLVISVCRFLM